MSLVFGEPTSPSDEMDSTTLPAELETNPSSRKRCTRDDDSIPTTAADTNELCTDDPRIVDVTGDLMTSRDSLAHCVSACLGMGKGIAVLFKKRFGRVEQLKAQNIGVGGVAVLDLRDDPKERRWVYYLITKPMYYHKPTYQSLEASLRQMLQHMTDHGVPAVAIPEIGCGLDLLEWSKVHALLQRLLVEYPAVQRVTVYHFPRK